jgi:hypothetical protein
MIHPDDLLQRAWEVLKADSIELAPQPLLEKRLMKAMIMQTTKRTWQRKLLIAAGLLLSFLIAGTGICVAAGYNPFKTITVMFDGNKVHITDENGNAVSGELVDMKVVEENGVELMEITVESNDVNPGKATWESTPQKK